MKKEIAYRDKMGKKVVCPPDATFIFQNEEGKGIYIEFEDDRLWISSDNDSNLKLMIEDRDGWIASFRLSGKRYVYLESE